ncbi:dihydroxyacetone kinase subunit DhaK [Muricomes intestini]|jgi:dihydroxyacetone kinase-like protein|uniref:dihydroxyacetone kinase subunit DhaK n=1 Tax=Muricomes intestini TaxID=1796634 RepID=UPI002FE20B30
MKELIFINKNKQHLDEVIQGIMAARPEALRRIENEYSYVLTKKELFADKVQVIVNGGGGRGPFFEGVVGEGMADAMVSGDFNCAPNAYMLYQTAKEIEQNKGILFIANNFMGDYLNNDMAKELLEGDGIETKVCYASDDIYSSRGENKENRGGLSGIGFIMKVAAAASESGENLKEVHRVSEKVNERTRSLSLCYNVGKNAIEFGNGFSGEKPTEILPYEDVNRVAEKVVGVLMNELGRYRSGRIHIMVNRMLYTSYAEGYIMLGALKKKLEGRGIKTGICTAGNYFDAYDYNGFIISFMAADDEIENYTKRVNGFDFTV